MFSLVHNERAFPVEALATVGAHVRFLSSVGFLVPQKVRGTREPFPTLCTLIWSLSSVDSLVYVQVGFQNEAFAAFRTLVRLFSRMRSPMRNKA